MSYQPLSENGRHDGEIVFMLDREGRFIFLNSAGERISGYSCAEARRMNIAEIVAPEFVGYVGDQLRHFRECFGLVYEIEIVTKDGRRVWLETSTHVTLSNDGQMVIEGIAVPAQRRIAPTESGSNTRCIDPDFAFEAGFREPEKR